jgi:alpha-glucuronidase
VADDGYTFWLRYDRVTEAPLLEEYRRTCRDIVVTRQSPILDSARQELARGINSMLGRAPGISERATGDGAILLDGAQPAGKRTAGQFHVAVQFA